MFRLLLEAGADRNVTAKSFTPTETARTHSAFDVLRTLKLVPPPLGGWTPSLGADAAAAFPEWWWAAEVGRVDLLKILFTEQEGKQGQQGREAQQGQALLDSLNPLGRSVHVADSNRVTSAQSTSCVHLVCDRRSS